MKTMANKAKSIMKVNVGNEAFYASERDTYGLDSFEDIIGYALQNKIDLVRACKDFGFDDEKIDLLRLIYARELYKDGMIKEGDVVLSSVDGSPKKTPLVKDVLNTVRSRKQFYQHRPVAKPQIKMLVRPGRRTIEKNK